MVGCVSRRRRRKRCAASGTRRWTWSATATTAADLGHPLQGFGVLVPRSEGVRSLGCLWSDSIFPGQAPAGQRLLRTIIGGAHDPDVLKLSEAELEAVAQQDLERLVGVKQPPRFTRIIRHEAGIAQYTLGHLDRVAQTEAAGSGTAGAVFYRRVVSRRVDQRLRQGRVPRGGAVLETVGRARMNLVLYSLFPALMLLLFGGLISTWLHLVYRPDGAVEAKLTRAGHGALGLFVAVAGAVNGAAGTGAGGHGGADRGVSGVSDLGGAVVCGNARPAAAACRAADGRRGGLYSDWRLWPGCGRTWCRKRCRIRGWRCTS